MSAVSRETAALQRIAAKQQVLPLRRRARRRERELRVAAAAELRYPNRRKSVVAVHAQDAQHGVRSENLKISRRAA
jgi:hypothetical protein